MIARKKVILRFSKASFFLWGFIVVAVVSTMRSVVVHSSILYLKWFVAYVLLFHLVVNLTGTERKQRLLIGSFLAGTALVGIIGLYQYFYGFEQMAKEVCELIPAEQQADYLARIERGRIFSTYTYPNSLAGFLVTVIPISLSACFLKRGWFHKDQLWKGILYLLVVILPLLASFVLTESKGGFLALGLVVLVGLLLAPRLFGLSKKMVIAALIVIIVVSTAVGISPVGKDLVEKGKYTFGERVQYWRAAVKMVPLRPFLGSGLFSFYEMYNKYRIPGANDTRTVHNNYLQILVETGLVGLVCFLGFWIMVSFLAIRSIVRELRSAKGLKPGNVVTVAAFLGILGFLLHNIVDFDLYVPGISMSAWFLAALVVINTDAAREHVYIFRKDSTVSIALISVAAICILSVFLTIKTLWGSVHFHIAYSIEKNPEKYPEFADPYAEVEIGFKNALWWDGTNHWCYTALGNLYLQRGHLEQSEEYVQKAIDAFERAISLNRYDPISRLRFINATRELMELKGEIDSRKLQDLWEDVIDYAPTASYYRLLYAEELRLAGKSDEAIKQYWIGYRLDSEFQNALQKATGRYNEQKIKEAIVNFEELIKTREE